MLNISIMSLVTILLIIPFTAAQSGCSIPSRGYSNSDEVIANTVYACAGTIDQGSGGMYGTGPGSAAALCSSGYHVCESSNELSALGMTLSMCAGIGSTTSFFGTKETRGTSNSACLSNGATLTTNEFWAYNDIYGCGAGATGSECGVLTKWIGNSDFYNWKISGTYDEGLGQDEALAMYLTDASSGGVLCCADQAPLTGCTEGEYNSEEVVEDRIYACAGEIEQGSGGMYGTGDGSAAALCSSGYHVCEGSNELKTLGMTLSICGTVGTSRSFFGTKETRGTSNSACLSNGATITENEFWAYNDVYGCGGGATGSECGVLTKWIGNSDWYNWRISGTYDEGLGQDEALAIYLTDSMSGGVLCCTDEVPLTGCSAESRGYDNSREVIEDTIYACAGTIDQGSGGLYGEGDGSAAELCSAGYHVCKSANEAAALGMTLEICANIGSTTEFFGTKETRGTSNSACLSNGATITTNGFWAYNDVYGCGAGATGSECGVFTKWIGNSDFYNWKISDTYDEGLGQDEALAIYLTDASSGGVLCCSNPVRERGCSRAEYNSKEVIANKIYACAGTITEDTGGMYGTGTGSAAELCAAGYHVCESANEAESLGMTLEMCGNIGTSRSFFATKETRGTNTATCLSNGAIITDNDFWAYNDVYGCGGGATGSECGVLTKWIGNSDWYNWRISGTYDEGKGEDEALVIYLTDPESGGVLCCAGPETPAPVTPAPVTPAPVTPAPITPAPVTPGPVTPATPTASPTFEPCDDDSILNVNFVMDKSGGITSFGYDRMINFVQALIEYSINDASVVSALSFSDNIDDLYLFINDQTSRNGILSILENERSNYVGAGASTYAAVMRGIDMFSEDGVIANPSGNLMFLITPANPNEALCDTSTGLPTALGADIIQELSERNIDLHLVGIGGASFDSPQVECLTSNRVKRVAGFSSDKFARVEEALRELLCPNQS